MVGQQIRFFFTPIDENLFLADLKKRGDVIITGINEAIEPVTADTLNNHSYSQVWIKSPQSRISLNSNRIIDRDESEIIEYSRSISDIFYKRPTIQIYNIPEDKRTLKPGRLWAAMRFFDQKVIELKRTSGLKSGMTYMRSGLKNTAG
jgi:hypothetical protein